MTHTPYRAIFFDLDGTLLPMDLDEFMGAYLNSLGTFVASHGLDSNRFSQGLMAGIKAMAEDDSIRSNAAVFWDTFYGSVPESEETWTPLFDDFYENHFGLIGKETLANPSVAYSLKLLKEKGYPLVLATMPMFPLRAVEWRCTWAGVDPELFERITYFDNSTSVKPKLAYYQENLTAAGLKPADVLMVGNNTREDLACMELGMDAYLITDCLINPNSFDLDTVRHGSYDDFVAWVETLAPCTDPAVSISSTLQQDY